MDAPTKVSKNKGTGTWVARCNLCDGAVDPSCWNRDAAQRIVLKHLHAEHPKVWRAMQLQYLSRTRKP